jgi:hypothetical protein
MIRLKKQPTGEMRKERFEASRSRDMDTKMRELSR